MTLTEVQEKVLTDDTFIMDEVSRMQYVYGLKYEIRYGLTRAKKDYTESVAEHSWGMHVVLDYFLALEPISVELDHNHLRQLVTWHDTVELITGDKISWQKTTADEAAELTAWKDAIPKLPHPLQATATTLVNEYEHQQTPEAQFVKAIDKVEPIFHMYTALGKEWCQRKQLTRFDSDRIKLPYVKQYQYITRFVTVVHDRMEVEGFFTPAQ